MRASQVIYDRAHASIADVDISEFDFDKILEGAEWFHTTGITPALSDKAAALTEAALKAAKAKGNTVTLKTTYTFSKPGTYFSVLRVSSQREGDTNIPYARIKNLASVRVVVK